MSKKTALQCSLLLLLLIIPITAPAQRAKARRRWTVVTYPTGKEFRILFRPVKPSDCGGCDSNYPGAKVLRTDESTRISVFANNLNPNIDKYYLYAVDAAGKVQRIAESQTGRNGRPFFDMKAELKFDTFMLIISSDPDLEIYGPNTDVFFVSEVPFDLKAVSPPSDWFK